MGECLPGCIGNIATKKNPLTKHPDFSMLAVEEEIVNDARTHLPDGASNIEVLTELQHYGGKTNLIDFTKDLYIALFFACDGEIDDDGQLILVDVVTLDNAAINYNKSKGAIKADNILVSPTGKNPRAIFQKSAFIHPRKGYLEKDNYQSVVIKAELKIKLLSHLREHHDISVKTIYNDIHGFIQNQSIETAANAQFFLGYSRSTSDDHEGAVQYYGEAIKLNPQMLAAYTGRGTSYIHLHRYDEAIVDYTKAIELRPRISHNYFLRGMAYRMTEKFDKAMDDHNKAIEIEPSRAAYYVDLGKVYYQLQQHNDAISEFKKALQVEPDNDDAHIGLGNTHKHLGNYKEALTHLRIARDLCIQKKFGRTARNLDSDIAELENTLAKNTRPNAKATKKTPPKAAKPKKRKK